MQLHYNNNDNHDSAKIDYEKNNEKKMINTKSYISLCGPKAQLRVGPAPSCFGVSGLHSVTHTPGNSPLSYQLLQTLLPIQHSTNTQDQHPCC